MIYDYDAVVSHVNRLAMRFGFVDLFTVGESVMEKKLYCLKIGVGNKKVFLTSGENGMEHTGSQLLMRFLETYAEAIHSKVPFFGHDSAELFGSVSLYALPMLNPDGVDIALHGLDITNPYHRQLISKTGIHSFAKVWRANANGVDLNTADTPFNQSEPETKALSDFLHSASFDALIQVKMPNSNPYYDYNTPPYQGGISGWFESEFSKPGRQVEVKEADGFDSFAKKVLGAVV